MNLFSVCEPDEVVIAYDGRRQWGDFDKCPRCGGVMDVWTERGISNENVRRQYSGRAALEAGGATQAREALYTDESGGA